MRMWTIVLADDHDVVRRGLRALFDAEAEFEVIGEGGDGLEVTEMVERLRPDILVLDVVMPGLNGLEVLRRVRLSSPQTRVIVFSMYDQEAYVLEALKAGAKAYVLKKSATEELMTAVHEVISGRYYLGSPISARAMDAYIEKAEGIGDDLFETLTAREREVLQLAAEGCTNAETAERLCISTRTAETHRSSAMRKLGLRTHTDLIRYALRRGILQMDG